MKNNILLLCLSIILFSCQEQDDLIKKEFQEKALHVTVSTNELSESNAAALLNNYINSLEKKIDLRSSIKSTISSTKKMYHKVERDSNLKNTRANINNSQDSVAIYNFTIDNNKGFGIVLGDIRFPQVLSYVPIGRINDTIYNEGLKEWVNEIPTYIDNLIDDYNTKTIENLNIEIVDEIKTDIPLGGKHNLVQDSIYFGNTEFYYWFGNYILKDAYIKITDIKNNIDKVFQTQWSQTSPFNDNMQLLPSSCNMHGTKIYTGCATTSIAQLIAYYEWPNRYNWSLLKQTPNIYNWSPTNQKSEVARLMKDIQDELTISEISCDATSISVKNMKKVLNRYFSYNENNILYNPSQDRNYPILRTGSTNSGTGHAYIVDGYREVEKSVAGYCDSAYYIIEGEKYTIPIEQYIELPINWADFDLFTGITNTFEEAYHINWGWGGASDGWYINTSGNRYTNNRTYFNNFTKK